MNKLLLTLCICLPLFAVCQPLPYTFTTLTGQTYSNLTNSVSVSNGVVWDDPEWTIGIGFDFEFFGTIYSEVTFYGLGGTLVLGGFPGYYDNVDMIAPYMQDVADAAYNTGGNSLSNISFKTEGTLGSQIFKLEWNNTSFYDDETGTSIVNFQLWMYEGTNNIEYRFGSSQNVNGVIDTGLQGFLVGMTHDFNVYSYSSDQFYALSGDQMSPTILELTAPAELYTATLLDQTPQNGTIYRFVSNPVGLEEINEEAGFSIQPNPVTEQAVIQSYVGGEINLLITAVNGETIESLKVVYGDNEISFGHLPAGMYIIRSEANPDVPVKFIKE